MSWKDVLTVKVETLIDHNKARCKLDVRLRLVTTNQLIKLSSSSYIWLLIHVSVTVCHVGLLVLSTDTVQILQTVLLLLWSVVTLHLQDRMQEEALLIFITFKSFTKLLPYILHQSIFFFLLLSNQNLTLFNCPMMDIPMTVSDGARWFL